MKLPQILTISVCALLGGCSIMSEQRAIEPTSKSAQTVSLSSEQSKKIASDTVKFLGKSFSPLATNIKFESDGGVLGKALLNSLIEEGYAVSENKDSLEFMYILDSMDSLKYLTFKLGDYQVNRVYRSSPEGGLILLSTSMRGGQNKSLLDLATNGKGRTKVKPKTAKIVKPVKAPYSPVIASMSEELKLLQMQLAHLKKYQIKPVKVKHIAKPKTAKIKPVKASKPKVKQVLKVSPKAAKIKALQAQKIQQAKVAKAKALQDQKVKQASRTQKLTPEAVKAKALQAQKIQQAKVAKARALQAQKIQQAKVAKARALQAQKIQQAKVAKAKALQAQKIQQAKVAKARALQAQKVKTTQVRSVYVQPPKKVTIEAIKSHHVPVESLISPSDYMIKQASLALLSPSVQGAGVGADFNNKGLYYVQLMAGKNTDDLEREKQKLESVGHTVRLVKLRRLTALRVMATSSSEANQIKDDLAFEYVGSYVSRVKGGQRV